MLLHDYGGYAFIAQLARELARRGHAVRHVHSASLRNGKGHLERDAADPPSLSFRGIAVEGTLNRYHLVDRVRLERAYVRQLARATDDWGPDVVVAADTPLLLLRWFQRHLTARGIPLVNWLQDVHSVAIGQEMARRLGPLGRAGSPALERVEARLARSCAHVVAITPAFVPVLDRWGVAAERVTVIPNWADLHPPAPRRNRFSAAHGLDGRRTLLYAGTLGLKHAPGELLALARALAGRPDVVVVVVSEGLGRDWLEQEARRHRLDNLCLVDFQPYERVPEVLGSGDALLTILRPEAAAFSVPSKVLSYLVAGRAQLASLPADNLAARVLSDSGAGLVVEPGDAGAWVGAAERLLDSPDLRQELGRRGRAYAEEHFDLPRVAERFETVLRQARAAPRAGRR